MRRRTFLSATGRCVGLVALQNAVSQSRSNADETGRAPRILLRSSWQTVNIGDIAHTPGVLAILEQHFPEAEVWLWPMQLNNGVDKLLSDRFPKLKIVKGKDALQAAFDHCDFLLHSSGPSLVAEKDVIRWHAETGKPYGVYGITLPLKKSSSTTTTSDDAMAQTINVLSGADFVFFRDSVSLELARAKGCTAAVMEYGPDGAFACDLADEPAADAFLTANGLEAGKFMCCIPRLRYTPYWTIPEKKRDVDPTKHARNEQMKEHDHAQLRRAIIEVVRQTDLKVLICPEDETQMAVGKEMLYDKLPADVKKRVAWRPNYWLTGEAISVYKKSIGLFGNEMHSPIMCTGHAIPAIVCRWSEQTSKGLMWKDIGLDDWLFDMDNPSDVKNIVSAVLEIAKNPSHAKSKSILARRYVRQRQQETMAVLKRSFNKK